jgi:hypothetical protein
MSVFFGGRVPGNPMEEKLFAPEPAAKGLRLSELLVGLFM